MKFLNKKIISSSPSDLNNFVACKYIIKNEIKFQKGEIKKNDEKFDQKLWKKFGLEHEKKHFKIFESKYKKNIIIKKDIDENKRFKETKEAIQKGYDLIYHAYFIDDNFRGEADFLIKSNDGSYEVYDTKISRNPKPRHIFQILAYSHMLSKIQKVMPKKMYLIDGSDKIHSYKTNEFFDYFIYTKKNFQNYLKNIHKEDIYPEKCEFCNLCDWSDTCNKKWEDDNYINQVAKSVKSQVEKFKKINIKTVENLAKTDAKKIRIKINKETLSSLILQAQLQEEKRKTGKSKCIILDPHKGKGFYKLPKPNEGDLFFDIEGFPQAEGRGFEYLHGLYFKEKKEMKFKFFWAKDFEKKYEEENFVKLIDFLRKHLTNYPDAHIYHYNTYEKRALRELASLYSSNHPEEYNFVDNILRDEKLVDLFLIVNQSIRTSEKDMSLKTIETFYEFQRKSDIVKAEESVECYDHWTSTKDEKIKKKNYQL